MNCGKRERQSTRARCHARRGGATSFAPRNTPPFQTSARCEERACKRAILLARAQRKLTNQTRSGVVGGTRRTTINRENGCDKNVHRVRHQHRHEVRATRGAPPHHQQYLQGVCTREHNLPETNSHKITSSERATCWAARGGRASMRKIG